MDRIGHDLRETAVERVHGRVRVAVGLERRAPGAHLRRLDVAQSQCAERLADLRDVDLSLSHGRGAARPVAREPRIAPLPHRHARCLGVHVSARADSRRDLIEPSLGIDLAGEVLRVLLAGGVAVAGVSGHAKLPIGGLVVALQPPRRYSAEGLLLAQLHRERDGVVRVYPLGQMPEGSALGRPTLVRDGSALFVATFDAESGWVCIELPASMFPSNLDEPA